jgi:hypothetical protein
MFFAHNGQEKTHEFFPKVDMRQTQTPKWFEFGTCLLIFKATVFQ